MVTRARDGSTWRIGTDAEVAWIAAGTTVDKTITSAIPPVFDAYATLVVPYRDEQQAELDRLVLALLSEQSADQPWWLGYLDTGASDIVFWDAPKVTLYNGWSYVLVLAGPDQAATWRPAPGGQPNWKSTELPDVMFPDDRSWLVSFLWDDGWACIGGPSALISDLLSDPILAPNARRVDTQQNAAPIENWPG